MENILAELMDSSFPYLLVKFIICFKCYFHCPWTSWNLLIWFIVIYKYLMCIIMNCHILFLGFEMQCFLCVKVLVL